MANMATDTETCVENHPITC